MFGIKKLSKWEFDTSGTGGIGFGPGAAQGGLIRLKDPHKNLVDFYFGGLGVGWSFIKIPSFLAKYVPKTISNSIGNYISKIKQPTIRGKATSGTIAPTWFDSKGLVLITDSFKGDELRPADFAGACMFVDIGGGLIASYSGCAMVLGMNPILLAAALAAPTAFQSFLMNRALKTATCIILMRGNTLGIIGVSAAVYVGYLDQEKVFDGAIRNLKAWLGKPDKIIPPKLLPRPVIVQKQPAKPPVSKRPSHVQTQKQQTRKEVIPKQRKKCFPDWQPLEGFPGWYWYFDGENPHFTDAPTCY